MTASATDPIKLFKGVFSVLNTLWTRFNNVPAIEVSLGIFPQDLAIVVGHDLLVIK